MKRIVKNNEPASLTLHRNSTHSTYENYADKDGLRRSLVSEQRGICCYCMGRIQEVETKMKIEHFQSQSQYPQEQLTYNNLFGSCLGNMNAKAEFHCDTFKGNKEFHYHMCTSGYIHSAIKYKANGEIYSDNATLNNELKSVLNLNLPELVKARKSTLDGFIKANLIGKIGNLNKAKLTRFRDKWLGTSHQNLLEPYCMIVVHYLDKKLASS